MRAINEIRLDHYLMKPWHPPEEHLYPVLDDLLEDWRAGDDACDPRLRRTDGDAVSVIGHHSPEESQRVRDLLANNQIAYHWLEVDEEPARRLLAEAELGTDRLPVVLLPDSEPLVGPDPAEVAARVDLQTEEKMAYYDLVIVGAGPAGLAAAVYGASEGLYTVVVERGTFGGQAGMSSRIENYLGFPSGLSGADLARRATTQARRFRAELLTAQEAIGVDVVGNTRVVRLAAGTEICSHTVLLAPGVSYRRLDAKGAERLTGRGIWYGTASAGDAALLDGQEAFVIGGANSAGQAALHLAQRGARDDPLPRREPAEVDVAVPRRPHRGDARGDHRAPEHAASWRHTERRRWSRSRSTRTATSRRFRPRRSSSSSAPSRTPTGSARRRPARTAATSSPAARCWTYPRRCAPWPLDRHPFALETSVPGVFAAGDVRDQSIKRVASAVGEGSMAVLLVHQYLKSH